MRYSFLPDKALLIFLSIQTCFRKVREKVILHILYRMMQKLPNDKALQKTDGKRQLSGYDVCRLQETGPQVEHKEKKTDSIF